MTLTLHMFPTLNAHKVTIALEEMGLAYEIAFIDILSGGQDDPAFRTRNPNGRIPVLTDGPVTVFESAAILQYLGRKSGQFYPEDEARRTEVDSWLFWQMAGLGPASGNVNWFSRAAAKEGRDPLETGLALHRFSKETARLFDVLETRLSGRNYLCGTYSIADMACWTWIDKYPDNGGGLASRPRLAAWHAAIAARPAVQHALHVGQEFVKP
ncbi:MAG: glutathione S-transferase family protein [Novosphingobium sp.]